MTTATEPTFSLGMPVYNGERYIRTAIESVLEQTTGDWELIICDNASTDATEQVCREYALRDHRVRYFRNPENIGAHPNYNRTLEHSRGRYFKWLAHDDELHPEFLAQCGKGLDEHADCVLCMTDIQYIDEGDRDIGVFSMNMPAARSAAPAARFHAFTNRGHTAYHVFGLIRRDVLASSVQLMSFHGSDRALIADLSLRGSFLNVAQPLARVREHIGRYTRQKTRPKERATWHDARLKGKISLPNWRLYSEYVGIVSHSRIRLGDKVRCFASLVSWWFVNWNAARMGVDLIAVVFPDIVGFAERLKQSAFAPAPGSDQIRRVQP